MKKYHILYTDITDIECPIQTIWIKIRPHKCGALYLIRSVILFERKCFMIMQAISGKKGDFCTFYNLSTNFKRILYHIGLIRYVHLIIMCFAMIIYIMILDQSCYCEASVQHVYACTCFLMIQRFLCPQIKFGA